MNTSKLSINSKNNFNNNLFLIEPTPIPNLGNTCFASTFLQLLFSCKDIITFIYNSPNNNNVIVCYKKLIKSYYYKRSITKEILRNFYNSIRCPIGIQDESADHLRLFLDILVDIEYLEILRLFGIYVVTKDTYEEGAELYKKYNGNYSSIRTESILDIKIPYVENKKITFNFNDLWNDSFFKIETIEVSTGKLNNEGKLIYAKLLKRKVFIGNDPKYIFINIQRIIPGTTIKLINNIDNIWMQKKILINKYTPLDEHSSRYGGTIDKNEVINHSEKFLVKYKLIGFSLHIGKTSNIGHWISYKLINNKWYRCSDDNINIVDENYIKKELKQSSLLLYEKIGESISTNIISKNRNTVNTSSNINKFSKIEKIERNKKYSKENKLKIIKNIKNSITPNLKKNMINKGFDPNRSQHLFDYKWHIDTELNNNNTIGMKLIDLNPIKREDYFRFLNLKKKTFNLKNILEKHSEIKKANELKKKFSNINLKLMRNIGLYQNSYNNLLQFQKIKNIQMEN